MKKSLLITAFLIIFSGLSLQARSGFGSSFGGAALGSFIGSSFATAASQPRVVYSEPTVVYRDTPRYNGYNGYNGNGSYELQDEIRELRRELRKTKQELAELKENAA